MTGTQKSILAILFVAAVFAVGAAVFVTQTQAFDFRKKKTDEKSDYPRMAVATVENLIKISQERQKLVQKQEEKEARDNTSGAVKLGNDIEDDEEYQEKQKAQIEDGLNDPSMQNTLIQAYASQFENELSGTLASSQRFAIADTSKLLEAYDLLLSKSPAPEKKSVFGFLGKKANNDEQGKGSVMENVRNATVPQGLRRDLTAVGEELGIEYILLVNMNEPRFFLDWDSAAYSEKSRPLLRANPIFVFRLLDIKNSKIVVAGQARLPRGLSIDMSRTALQRLVSAKSDSKSTSQAFEAVRAELNYAQLDQVSGIVRQRVLDAVFPPMIASIGTDIVIDRGAADGLRAGDKFEVVSIGKIKSGSGKKAVEIDAPGEVKGQIEVVRVEENVAVVRQTAQLVEFSVGDRVRHIEAATGNENNAGGGRTGNGGSERAKLGTGISQEQGSGIERARVAVTNFDIQITSGAKETGLDFKPIQNELARAISRRLTGDPRFVVLSRQDLDRIREEDRLKNGDSIFVGEGAKFDRANYLVGGTIRIDTDILTNTANMRGKRADVSTQYTLIASGEVAIVDSASTQIAAERVVTKRNVRSAAQAQDERLWSDLVADFATQAGRLLQVNLYPIKVQSDVNDDGPVVINAGSAIGLAVGDIVTAYNIGKPVIDFDSKVVLAPGVRKHAGTLRVANVDKLVSYLEFTGQPFVLSRGDEIVIEPPKNNRLVNTESRSPVAKKKDRKDDTPF